MRFSILPIATRATITIEVVEATIDALADNYTSSPVNGYVGNSNVGDALDNDTLNGLSTSLAEVSLAVVTPASNPGVALDELTGIVSVAPGTPAGAYAIVYRICEILNPSNCDNATITVLVQAAVIDAVDDDYSSTPVNGYVGEANVGNALDNDTLNGDPAGLSEVTITVLTPAGDPGVTLAEASGIVSVAPGVPAGTYTIVYSLCEDLNPANCDTAHHHGACGTAGNRSDRRRL